MSNIAQELQQKVDEMKKQRKVRSDAGKPRAKKAPPAEAAPKAARAPRKPTAAPAAKDPGQGLRAEPKVKAVLLSSPASQALVAKLLAAGLTVALDEYALGEAERFEAKRLQARLAARGYK